MDQGPEESVLKRSVPLLAVTLDEQRYALHLSSVERVVRAVEITPLPKAPEIVLGVINIQGKVIPVVNVRERFRLPERPLELSDRIIFAHSSRRSVALVVDAVSGVIDCAERDMIAAERIVPRMEYIEGIAKLEDGLILIHDLDRFLSLDEEKRLDNALHAEG